jgi:hypothetical protein
VWETKFHTHTEQQIKLWFCVFQSVSCYRGDDKTKDSEQNDKKRSLILVSSWMWFWFVGVVRVLEVGFLFQVRTSHSACFKHCFINCSHLMVWTVVLPLLVAFLLVSFFAPFVIDCVTVCFDTHISCSYTS